MIKQGSLMKLAALVPVSVVALAAAFTQPAAFNIVPDGRPDRHIVEAVFRYQLHQYSQESTWNVFYLALGWDPDSASDESVAAFGKHTKAVKKFIKSEYDAARIKKEKGIVLGVAEIKKSTETEAEVEGYIFVVPGEAQGFRFSLIRENGKWLVKSSKATWVAWTGAEQALAADGAIAWFPSNLVPLRLNADRAPQLKRNVRCLR